MKNRPKQEEITARGLQELPVRPLPEPVPTPQAPTTSLDTGPLPSRGSLDRRSSLSLEIKAWEWLHQQPNPARFSVDPTGPSETAASSALETSPIEKLENLITREVVSFRHLRAEALTVVLRPDPRTEMLLHLNRRDGQMEALVRCEPQLLESFHRDWPQLQESLAQLNVRLLPLRDHAPVPQSTENPTGNSANGFDLSHREPHHRHPAEPEPYEPRPSGHPAGPAARNRPNPNPRPRPAAGGGWESWA